MAGKPAEKKKEDRKKLGMRILCLILAISMGATVFLSLISYLLSL